MKFHSSFNYGGLQNPLSTKFTWVSSSWHTDSIHYKRSVNLSLAYKISWTIESFQIAKMSCSLSHMLVIHTLTNESPYRAWKPQISEIPSRRDRKPFSRNPQVSWSLWAMFSSLFVYFRERGPPGYAFNLFVGAHTRTMISLWLGDMDSNECDGEHRTWWV